MINIEKINKLLKILILTIIFIGINTIISKAAIYSTDPTATTNSTVSITVTSNQALQNFNMDVTNPGGLTFSSVSTKGISNGTAVGYITLTEPLTTLGTYTFKTPSSPGTYKVIFDVNGISNTSTVTVTAPSDNSSNNSNNNETQKSPTEVKTEKSNIATLSNLGIRPNDFSGFSPIKTSYSVTVPNEVESVEVYATKGQSGQTVSGTGTKKLAEGANTVNVTVTAEDGKTTKTYTINITRSIADDEEEKEDEEDEDTEEEKQEETENTEEGFGLKELIIEGLDLQPQFQSDIYEYKIELKEDLAKLDLSALATEEDANIEITGNENLQEGENVITIIVKSKDEEKTIAYQIIVNKVLNVEENTSNQEQQKKIIIMSAIGGVVLIIIVVIVVVVVKKHKKGNDSSIPYFNLLDNPDLEEINNLYQENNVEDEIYEEQPKKKKHSKGKRFK